LFLLAALFPVLFDDEEPLFAVELLLPVLLRAPDVLFFREFPEEVLLFLVVDPVAIIYLFSNPEVNPSDHFPEHIHT
jgi:hypothetical protein